MAPQQLIALAALLLAAVVLPRAESRRFMLAEKNGTTSSGVAPTPKPSATVATSSSGVSSALKGTLEAPNFWWGTPANVANSTYKEETKVYKNETYFKVISLDLPYTIVLKYTEASGSLWLGKAKGSQELGQVAPKGKEGSVYAYTFPPQRKQRVVYISEQDSWNKTNTYLPIKME